MNIEWLCTMVLCVWVYLTFLNHRDYPSHGLGYAVALAFVQAVGWGAVILTATALFFVASGGVSV